MGLCGYFCEWANEIKARKFVPQHHLNKIMEIQTIFKHIISGHTSCKHFQHQDSVAIYTPQSMPHHPCHTLQLVEWMEIRQFLSIMKNMDKGLQNANSKKMK